MKPDYLIENIYQKNKILQTPLSQNNTFCESVKKYFQAARKDLHNRNKRKKGSGSQPDPFVFQPMYRLMNRQSIPQKGLNRYVVTRPLFTDQTPPAQQR